MIDLIFCPHCGQRLAMPGRFCGSCGAALPSGQPVIGTDDNGAENRAAENRPAGDRAAENWAVGDWAGRTGLTRERFATGDWSGAALAAVSGVGAMTTFTTMCLLLIGGNALPAGQLIAAIAMATALAAGGSLNVSGEAFDQSASATISFLPLSTTVLGFTLIAVVFVRRLRLQRVHTLVDVTLQAARVWVVLLACLLVVSLVGRVQTDSSSSPGAELFGGLGVHMSTAIASTLFFGSCLLLLALSLAVAWRVPGVLPPRLRGWRDVAAGPTAGVVTTLALSWLASAGFLVAAALASASSADGGAPDFTDSGVSAGQVIGGLLLLGPTVLLAVFGFALGVPANTDIRIGAGLTESVTLLNATDSDPRFWIVPVVAAVAVLAGGIVAALYAPSPRHARRTGWRFGIALAALLATIAITTAVSSEAAASLGGSFHLDYVIAALLGFVWGALGGWFGALLAPGLPAAVITSVPSRVEQARHHPGPGGQLR